MQTPIKKADPMPLSVQKNPLHDMATSTIFQNSSLKLSSLLSLSLRRRSRRA
jgi:hypothetical protein